MPDLTRRQSPDRSDCWHIYFGNVHVGTIAKANSIPNAEPRWQWLCGFYPGSEMHLSYLRGSARGIRLRMAGFFGNPYRGRLSGPGAITATGRHGNMP
jgi:hypothetical protein